MEMWGWLVPWWNWWADFADLFDWEAIGAIGTVAAFAAGMHLADASNRERRMRDAAIVLAASYPITSAAGILRHGLGHIEKGQKPEEVFSYILEAGGLPAQMAHLESIALPTLPSVRAMDPFMAGKACIQVTLQDITDSLERKGYALDSLPEEVKNAVERMDKYSADLVTESERIIHRGAPF